MNELLILVRSALEENPAEGADYEAVCRWGPLIWEHIIEQARRQSVLGLVYCAVTLLPEDTPIPEDLVFKLVAEGAAIEERGRLLSYTAERLLDQLRHYGFHPVLMKGPETAKFYPRPELREYGDIDLYLPPEEIETAIAQIRNAGYTVSEDADGSFQFNWGSIDVDVHQRFFDLFCPPSELPSPGTPEATLLMLSAHALKHAAGAGVGLRHICDFAVALRAMEGRYDSKVYLNYCQKAGILRWSRLLSSFLSVYLHVPDRLFPENNVSPEPLLAIVRKGGNFGHHAAGRQDALNCSPLLRKTDTALRFLRHLPFSLRYAPREVLPRIRGLIRGNRKPPRLRSE